MTRTNHLSIRDLQKISGETIGALPGPTAVKSGDRTIALDIWTADRDFAGTGVATWSTPNLMRALAEAGRAKVR